MKMLHSKKGFTLIELMIVVAIIGILAAIAIPQFAQLISKSQEGATKGNLGTIRSALSIYYGDTEGYYPLDNLASLLLGSKYLKVVPNSNLPKTASNGGHAASPTVVPTNLTTAIPDAGGWAYDNSGQGNSASWGNVIVGCSHNDLRNAFWTSY